jgi:hypothetical protein
MLHSLLQEEFQSPLSLFGEYLFESNMRFVSTRRQCVLSFTQQRGRRNQVSGSRSGTARKATRDQRTLHQGFRSGSFGCDEELGSVFGHAGRVFSKCSAGELVGCGKLFKVNAGEVAERLKAAVC